MFQTAVSSFPQPGRGFRGVARNGFRGLGDASTGTGRDAILQMVSEGLANRFKDGTAADALDFLNGSIDYLGYPATVSQLRTDLMNQPVRATPPAWLTQLIGGGGSVVTPQTAVQQRPDLASVIEGFYNAYYSRGSDPGGLEFYTQQLINGVSRDQIAQAFINSDEYRTVHPPHDPGPAPPAGGGGTAPVVIVTQPPVTTTPPATTISGMPDTITLPVVGAVKTKTALLVGAGIAAYFFLGK